MSYAPFVMAAVSALGSYMGSRAAASKLRKRQKEMSRLASPEHLREVIQKLLPFYRELAAGGLGPQFLQESAREISNAGLSGTGVGEAMRTISKAVPTAIATGQAGEAAQGVVGNELGALGSQPVNTANPLIDALTGGLRAYVGTKEAMRTAGAGLIQKETSASAKLAPTTTPVDYSFPPDAGPPLFPQTKPISTLNREY